MVACGAIGEQFAQVYIILFVRELVTGTGQGARELVRELMVCED